MLVHTSSASSASSASDSAIAISNLLFTVKILENENEKELNVFDVKTSSLLQKLTLNECKSIRCIASNEKFLVLAMDPKRISIYSLSDDETTGVVFSHFASFIPSKTVTSLFLFEDKLFYSDKFGDVYRYEPSS